jgi:type IV pilus assembly protein PilM
VFGALRAAASMEHGMASNVCWGIEIGSGGIKALKLELDGDKVFVSDYADIQHSKVLSTPGVEVNDALRVSLGALVSQYEMTGVPIAISVPGHSSFARFAKLPPVEPKKVPDIVKFEAVQQIPFPLEQVEWDYQTFMSPDSPDIEVGIFAITQERIAERLNMLADVGITPDYVTLSPVALYNAMAYDLQFTEQTPGTILLDVGTTSTDLVVAESGRVWVRTFPLGGHQFTQALVDQFKLSYPKAEKIKRDVHDSQHARQVFQAMRPIFTDLTQDVQRSIGYYQSLHREANLQRLIGVGSTFHLPGLRKYLKQQLSMDVYRLEEFKRLDLSRLDEARSTALKNNALAFATAYGLAIQGLGLNPIKANLMPVSVIRGSMWKKKRWMFATAAGIGLLAGASLFVRPVLDSSAVDAARADPVIQQAVSLASKLKSTATEAKVLEAGSSDHRAANMLQLLENRGLQGMLLADLSAVMEDADQKAAAWSGRPRPGVEPPKPIGGPGYIFKEYTVSPSANKGGGGGEGGEGGEEQLPRLSIKLKVETNQPDPQSFFLITMDQWLRANKERADVPYRIEIKDPAYTLLSAGEAGKPDEPAATPDAVPGDVPGVGGSEGPENAPQPSERGGRAGRGRFGREGAPPPDAAPGGQQFAEADSSVTVTLIDGPSQPKAVTGAGSPELTQLAPLGGLKPAAASTRKPAILEVQWDIVLVAKKPPAEGEGADAKGSEDGNGKKGGGR